MSSRRLTTPTEGCLSIRSTFSAATPTWCPRPAPGDRVFAVQVSDAPASFDGDYGEATFHRLLPGDGASTSPGSWASSAARRTPLDRPRGISPVTPVMPQRKRELATERLRDIVHSVRARAPSDR